MAHKQLQEKIRATIAVTLPPEMVAKATAALIEAYYGKNHAQAIPPGSVNYELRRDEAIAALVAADVPGLVAENDRLQADVERLREEWQAMKVLADATTDIGHVREEELVAELIATKAEIVALRAQLAVVKRERKELQRTLDLQWEASRRAIKLWRAAHPGKEDTWPDMAALCVWLMERLDDARWQGES